jgi:hypothetical protein
MSGYGNTGTLTNMNLTGNTSSGLTTNGRFGNALVFDGVNDYVNAGNSSNLKNRGTSNFTVEGWVKGAPNNNGGYIISTRQTNIGTEAGLGLALATDGKFNIYFSDGSAYRLFLSGNGNFADGGWHQFVTTFNRNENMTIYRDGVYDNTSSISAQQGSIISSSNFYIGAANSGGTSVNSFFNGTIDEVQIWNRELTRNEISILYQNNMEAGHYAVMSNTSDNILDISTFFNQTLLGIAKSWWTGTPVGYAYFLVNTTGNTNFTMQEFLAPFNGTAVPTFPLSNIAIYPMEMDYDDDGTIATTSNLLYFFLALLLSLTAGLLLKG